MALAVSKFLFSSRLLLSLFSSRHLSASRRPAVFKPRTSPRGLFNGANDVKGSRKLPPVGEGPPAREPQSAANGCSAGNPGRPCGVIWKWAFRPRHVGGFRPRAPARQSRGEPRDAATAAGRKRPADPLHCGVSEQGKSRGVCAAPAHIAQKSYLFGYYC